MSNPEIFQPEPLPGVEHDLGHAAVQHIEVDQQGGEEQVSVSVEGSSQDGLDVAQLKRTADALRSLDDERPGDQT